MSDREKTINEGYKPGKVDKGYQPSQQPSTPTESPAHGGYIPTRSGGDNPSNNPTPPGDE